MLWNLFSAKLSWWRNYANHRFVMKSVSIVFLFGCQICIQTFCNFDFMGFWVRKFRRKIVSSKSKSSVKGVCLKDVKAWCSKNQIFNKTLADFKVAATRIKDLFQWKIAWKLQSFAILDAHTPKSYTTHFIIIFCCLKKKLFHLMLASA
jgi:hypothetical protein